MVFFLIVLGISLVQRRLVKEEGRRMSTRIERLFLMILALALLAFVLAPLMLMVATSLKADEQQILLDFGNFSAFWSARAIFRWRTSARC